MYAKLVLYTEPRRPLINPKFDLFAWLDADAVAPNLFPARIVDSVQLMLPEKQRNNLEHLSPDMWKFIEWQAEEKGYAVVRSIDSNWLYWSVLADKFTLLNMIRVL